MTQADFDRMRSAAHNREWNTLQDTLKRLLTQLDPLIALSIAAPGLQGFLPTFENYYPQATWVRELLLTVINYASAPRDLPIHAIREFNQPGCGNFVMAVFEAAHTVQDGTPVFERYSHITNTIANSILAQLQHSYYANHPDAFAQLHTPGTLPETITRIQADFWRNEAIAQQDKTLWLAVIQALEEHYRTL